MGFVYVYYNYFPSHVRSPLSLSRRRRLPNNIPSPCARFIYGCSSPGSGTGHLIYILEYITPCTTHTLLQGLHRHTGACERDYQKRAAGTMLLQRRGGLLCCGCGASAVAVAVSGRVPEDDGAVVDGQPPDAKSVSGTTVSAAVMANARQLSWAQVEAMTGGFTSAIVGEGGFSTVYLARLAGSLAAVKVHRSSERLHRAFRQELDALLRVRHPHIVRLLAFCDQRGRETVEFVHSFPWAGGGPRDRVGPVTGQVGSSL